MKNHKTIFAALGLAVLALVPAAGAQSNGSKFAWKDTVVVPAGETRDSVACFGGDINIEGKVRKGVFGMGGTITVSGEVGEAVVGLGSRIVVKSGALIKGDLVSLGGTIEKEPGFRVEGDTVYLKGAAFSERVFKNGLLGFVFFPFWPIILVFKLVNLFLWFLAALFLAMLLPKNIARAAEQVRTAFWPTLATGILGIIAFGFLIIFSAILCLVLIGIPILFTLATAGLAVKVFGRVTLFYFFGESLARSFKWGKPTVFGASVLGLVAVGFLGFIPILGILFTAVIDVLGWGLAIRTKFGSVDNWFKKNGHPPAAAPIPSASVPPPPAV
jgi:hypothetical protein